MNRLVHTWKDETNCQDSSVEEQVVLPANLAGEIDLTDEELEAVYGAWSGGYQNSTNSADSKTSTGNAVTSSTPPIIVTI